MTGNASFATPTPTLAAVTAAADALSEKGVAARTARLAAVNATSEQDAADTALDTLLSQLASYVDMTANGSAEVIRSAGMQVRAGRTPATALPAPVIKEAVIPAERGAVELKWLPLPTAKVYVIEHTPDMTGQTGWTNGADFTRTRGVVTGLAAGQRYLFRVRPLEPDGGTARRPLSRAPRWDVSSQPEGFPQPDLPPVGLAFISADARLRAKLTTLGWLRWADSAKVCGAHDEAEDVAGVFPRQREERNILRNLRVASCAVKAFATS